MDVEAAAARGLPHGVLARLQGGPQACPDPFQHVGGPIGPGAAHGHFPLLALAVDVSGGGDQYKALLGARHRHIEQARFLGAGLPVLFQLDGLAPEGIMGQPPVGIDQLERRAAEGIQRQQVVFLPAHAKAVGQVRQEDHGKLKALGFVDGHDTHDILAGAQGGGGAGIVLPPGFLDPA